MCVFMGMTRWLHIIQPIMTQLHPSEMRNLKAGVALNEVTGYIAAVELY